MFLQDILNKSNCVFGSFNSHRSAISLILPGSIGDNPILKRFMKGISKMRPQRPRYNAVWDPKQVLDLFDSRPAASLKLLSMKVVVTLLLLATGQRLQTISKIKVANIRSDEDGIQILIDDRIKTSGLKSQQPCLVIPKFQDKPNLCVVSCLTAYIAATTTLRDPKEEYLWITFQKPHKVATKATLSRWVKNALEMAGVDTKIFKPHSSRHASTSAASRTGVSLDVIKDSGGWSKNSATFANFYNRPLVDRYQFSLNVLNS
nr:unnamed protein product [Callosobruchus analis]